MKVALITFLLIGLSVHHHVNAQLSEAEMREVLATYDREASIFCNKQSTANWNSETDSNNKTLEAVKNEITVEYAAYRKAQYDEYFKDANPSSYTDPDIRRKIMILKDVGTAALSDDDLKELIEARDKMKNVYNNGRICPFGQATCNLAAVGMTLDPEIELKMASSEDFDELKWIWEEWHDKSGKLMRNDYQTYVTLMNKAAVANGHKDAGEMWRSRYEDGELIKKIDDLWTEVEPLYDALQKYVRYQLQDLYGEKINKSSNYIPAHLLGNMWAQSWVHLYDRVKPFKNASLVDVTSKMEQQNYSIRKMFEMSDEFYQSMGLPSSAMSYSAKAVIEKPEQVITCHASAWDFCDGEDFRIKMCTKINMEDFVTVHHEMGHIMYYLLYKDQPLLYRTGANPGFHEAVGDTIALSVSTPQHLKTVGLLDEYDDSEADNINALLHMALERLAFLPFGLLIDKWRWDVFSGEVPQNQWNAHWWELRRKYQKIEPPTARGEEFFDPGAKYHVPADVPYIRYYVAHIVEFSFYRSLCIEAGQFDPNNPSAKPLHKCDFYNNKNAGNKLRAGLELGYSKHWNEALEILTGDPQMSAKALLDYFAPLQTFLEKQNAMRDVLSKYEEEASLMYNKMVKAEWDVATDTENNAKKAVQQAVVIENANFSKHFFEQHFKGQNPDDYTDEIVRRQLKYLTKLGRDALPEADLTELTVVQSEIETIYNTAKICPFAKQNCNLTTEGLTLDPEISQIMTTSTNYDELKWAWQQWRDNSGKKMRGGYKKYVDILNEAAKLNGHKDNGEMWREAYEDDKFQENVDKMWLQVEPLYKELHTYVKHKLEAIYDKDMDKNSEFIPAHVLGNMWAQSWVNLYERIKPYKEGSLIDISKKLNDTMTVLQMFEESDKFYKSLGLEPNDMSYDERRGAVIHKPTDRVITCHASAWDFYDQTDFRIKMCTSVNQEDFITVHHEMGHIQYFILYKNQPLVLRTGANPGFHEAVGDLIALSVSTPQHLQKIKLLDEYGDTDADNINALFKMALERVAFLPFGLLIDKWRWDVFSGTVKEENWNSHWWDLRQKYQKITAPVSRNESDFDPGAKYHIPADSQYIAYFIAHLVQFQLHRALCIEAGQYQKGNPDKPLHKCDIEGSLLAGKKLRAGLELGLSKHWSVALKEMTGETEISGEAVLEYFQPLYEFLKEANSGTSGIVAKIVMIVGSVIGGFFVMSYQINIFA